MKKIIQIILIVLLFGACAKPAQPKRPVFTLDDYPLVDGSTVTIPFSEALCAKLTDNSLETCRTRIYHNKTHPAYLNLILKNVDLIFVTSPSQEELAYAASNLVELEVIPITSEAFVFLTSADNPVESLTLQQVQKIYTGEITNWKEVGGNDMPIIAFQRPVNSGSQTGFLELVMQGLTPSDAPTEWVAAEMGELVDKIAGYQNGPSAIGYSYYYFVTDMWKDMNVKLIKIDGVYPDKTTISTGQYPITTAYYAVIRKDEPKKSEIRNIIAWILSPNGQQLVEDAGYV
ncbi:MAG: hypothetical protein E4G74_00975, partial [Erysipelotrichales bacterium]